MNGKRAQQVFDAMFFQLHPWRGHFVRLALPHEYKVVHGEVVPLALVRRIVGTKFVEVRQILAGSQWHAREAIDGGEVVAAALSRYIDSHVDEPELDLTPIALGALGLATLEGTCQ